MAQWNSQREAGVAELGRSRQSWNAKWGPVSGRTLWGLDFTLKCSEKPSQGFIKGWITSATSKLCIFLEGLPLAVIRIRLVPVDQIY